jgi:FkbM family methyltransferase
VFFVILSVLSLFNGTSDTPTLVSHKKCKSTSTADKGFREHATAAETTAAGEAVVNMGIPAWAFATAAAEKEAVILAGPAPPIQDLQVVGRCLRAQFGEDILAYQEYFPGKRGGMILESGALDGDILSTSWFFVYCLDWRAVHIEPNPTNYASLAKKRSESMNLNVALCNTSQTVQFLSRSGVGGIWSFMNDAYRQKFHSDLLADPAKLAELLTPIACRRINTLLALFGIKHIDFWVLDVEGAEEDVLLSVDFSRIVIDVICVEADIYNLPKNERIKLLLASHGYIFMGHRDFNDWFALESFMQLKSDKLHG